MKDGHIAFEKMSDLYDGEIATIDEREQILEHLENCPMCAELYAKLKRTMNYLTDLKCQDFECVDFIDKTITEIKVRKKKKLFFKVMPAVAATVLIVIGASFIVPANNTGLNNSIDYAANEDLNDSEEVIQIIRKHNASILKVSDFYIEGEVKKSKFNQLRRDLGFRKVAFNLSRKSNQIASNENNWRSGFEEVALGDSTIEDELFAPDPQKDEYVRFKVFR